MPYLIFSTNKISISTKKVVPPTMVVLLFSITRKFSTKNIPSCETIKLSENKTLCHNHLEIPNDSNLSI